MKSKRSSKRICWSNQKEPPRKDMVELRDTDVLLGRGHVMTTYFGNVKFRCIMWKFRDEYQAAALKDKATIVDKVVKLVGRQKPPGRFLECYTDKECINGEFHKPGSETGWRYYIAPRQRVYDKVSATLRDKKLLNPFVAVAAAASDKGQRKPISGPSLTSKTISGKFSGKTKVVQKKTKVVKPASGVARQRLVVPGLTFKKKKYDDYLPRKKDSVVTADTTDTAPESGSSDDESGSADAAPAGLAFRRGSDVYDLSTQAEFSLQVADVICDGDTDIYDSFAGNIMFDNFVGKFATEYWNMMDNAKSCRDQKMVFFNRVFRQYATENPHARFVALVRDTLLKDGRCILASQDEIHTRIYSTLCLVRKMRNKIGLGAVFLPERTLKERTNSVAQPESSSALFLKAISKRRLDVESNDNDELAASYSEQPEPKKLRTVSEDAAKQMSLVVDDGKAAARIHLLAVDDDYFPEDSSYFEWATFMSNAQEFLAARRAATCDS